ncbi:hypothetical protein MIND_00371000 [Mycena indigotica]|uniref:Uncharacterized protein n=1 Tax=Mycena indigotica TaxID=2126181 RepID=A0A8H6T433_9AGAR|nr:uncharacterized protein MIND_00371000 [Mycena indigotica]KAF7309982.1 hypothetical protein MIND_00371000 [Mycena indigotica]
MPPRKKQKTVAVEDSPPVSFPSRPVTRPSQTTTGIFTLPLELLWLISTHFGLCIEVPHGILRGDGDPVLGAEFRSRTTSLRAMAYTCDQLRQVYRPLLWQSWNICVEPVHRAAFYKSLGDHLRKASLALAREAETRALIRTINVVLTRYSSAEVIPPFARCMAQMPNLHTLQIIHAHTQMTTHLKNGFANITLSNIQRIVLPDHAHEILRCCPEVRHVICMSSDGSKLVSAIGKCCKQVEIIEGFRLGEGNLLKRLVKAAPNVTEIRLKSFYGDHDTVTSLSSFKKLQTLEFSHQITLDELAAGAALQVPAELVKSIDAAKVLLRNQTTTDKRLRVRFTHDIPRNWHGAAARRKNWEEISETPFPVKEIPL